MRPEAPSHTGPRCTTVPKEPPRQILPQKICQLLTTKGPVATETGIFCECPSSINPSTRPGGSFEISQQLQVLVPVTRSPISPASKKHRKFSDLLGGLPCPEPVRIKSSLAQTQRPRTQKYSWFYLADRIPASVTSAGGTNIHKTPTTGYPLGTGVVCIP